MFYFELDFSLHIFVYTKNYIEGVFLNTKTNINLILILSHQNHNYKLPSLI